jgi:hypothetical protein
VYKQQTQDFTELNTQIGHNNVSCVCDTMLENKEQ